MNHFKKCKKMKHIDRFCHFLARFKQECRGVAAVEFALIFPILLVVYFGLVEMSNALDVRRKVENTANLTGMLVAQADKVDNAYMNNLFEASKMAFEPFDIIPLKVVVSSIVRTQDNNGTWTNTVDWSDNYGNGSSARTQGSVLNPPDNVLDDNRSVIVTEVEYKYSRLLTSNVFSDFVPDSITFKRTYWSHPRYVVSIPFE